MNAAASPYILIVGAGAIGALYGSALSRQGARVAVVCRSEYEVVKRDGYAIRSPLLGDHVFRPHAVFRNVAECTEHPDYLLLTSKVLPDVDRAALIRPAVHANTTIVLIQNGIDIEADVADAFASNELLSSLAFVQVGRGQPGQVNHQAFGWLLMGNYPSGITPAAERIAALFKASGVECKLTDDPASARWQKAVWNTTFNPLSILGGVLDTAQMLRTERDRMFVRDVMQEVCDVAAAAGHPQSPKLIDSLIGNTHAAPGYKTSMALDYENRRPMEIEAILGNVVRAGRKLHVAVPKLETIYAVAQMVAAARDDR